MAHETFANRELICLSKDLLLVWLCYGSKLKMCEHVSKMMLIIHLLLQHSRQNILNKKIKFQDIEHEEEESEIRIESKT